MKTHLFIALISLLICSPDTPVRWSYVGYNKEMKILQSIPDENDPYFKLRFQYETEEITYDVYRHISEKEERRDSITGQLFEKTVTPGYTCTMEKKGQDLSIQWKSESFCYETVLTEELLISVSPEGDYYSACDICSFFYKGRCGDTAVIDVTFCPEDSDNGCGYYVFLGPEGLRIIQYEFIMDEEDEGWEYNEP